MFHPKNTLNNLGYFHSSSTYIASFPPESSLISSWFFEWPFFGIDALYILLEDSNLRCFIFPSKMSLPQIIIAQIFQSSNHFLIKICLANLQIVLSNQKQHSRNFHSKVTAEFTSQPPLFPGCSRTVETPLRYLKKSKGRGGQNGGNCHCLFLKSLLASKIY